MNRGSRNWGSIIERPAIDVQGLNSWLGGFHSELRTPNSELPAAAAGLYIHVPFCATKCPYCDFYSSTDLHRVPGFLEALAAEMDLYRGDWGFFDTVYIGGGTPTAIPMEGLERVMAAVREKFVVASDAEVTLEANPGDVNRASWEAFKTLGINRLNIGIQSFDPAVLAFLGRRHGVVEAEAAVNAAREAGFDRLGMDLIYAVPGQDVPSWMRTLDRAVAYAPEHLSCYELTIEPHTPLGRRHSSGGFPRPSEELQRAFFVGTSELLEAAGYVHYEVSNFARGPSLASQHNQKYWDHAPYLGLGPSAHSYLDGRRWWNHRALDRYGEAVRSNRAPVAGEERLTEEQQRLEALYLSLRTKRGVDLGLFSQKYGCDLLAERGEVIAQLQEAGLLVVEDGFLRPTRAGLAVADQLAVL